MDNTNNNWYEDIERQISLLKEKSHMDESRKYELELLLRIAKRVVNLSPHCSECSSIKGEITEIYTSFADESHMTISNKQSPSMILFNAASHLDVAHGLTMDRGKWWPPIITGIVIGAVPGLAYKLITGTQELDTGADIGWTVTIVGVIIGGIIGFFSSNMLRRKI